MNHIFANSNFAYLLLCLPILGLIYLRRRLNSDTGIPLIVDNTLPKPPKSLKLRLRVPVIIFFRGLALCSIIIALMRPQLGVFLQDRNKEARDILISVDISGSMRALDFQINNQEVSRLDILKKVVKDFIAGRAGDRLGLLVFGTEVFTQCPLTLDHNLLIQYLNSLEVGMAGDSTSLGDAVLLSAKRLSNIKSNSKAIVLVTDGLKTSGQTEPIQSAEIAKKLNIKIYTVGIGGSGSAPFPVTDMFGREVIVYKDVPLDEDTLKKIAEITGGRYFNAKSTEELVKVYEEIDQLELRLGKAPQFLAEREYVDFLLPLALCFIVIAEILDKIFFRILE